MQIKLVVVVVVAIQRLMFLVPTRHIQCIKSASSSCLNGLYLLMALSG